ncbi:MAG: hydrogenase/urease maturation nickel metallochaperone HypA [Proteobacteria bacterium]|nr:hydrogenase/urease maturation nickel metallochaperone HypA [Pseudomonadota bacterium]
MHEASIALATIEAIKELERKEKIKAEKVFIEIGQGSGVNISALSFCLNQITEAENLSIKFHLTDVPIEGYCKKCDEKFTLKSLTSVCPKCESLSFEIISGCELNIKEIEGEEIEGKGSISDT